MVRIHNLLLDSHNCGDAFGERVGDLISRAGREHLWGERSGRVIDTVVIHYMSACEVLPEDPYNRARILRIFCDYGVSSHFLISRRGAVYRLVPEDGKAWHCGGSIMPDGRTGVNDFSIGIELIATSKSGFTRLQIRALCELCHDLEKRHGRQFTYVGHDAISGESAVAKGLRSDVKVDPGELFDWQHFRECLERMRRRGSNIER